MHERCGYAAVLLAVVGGLLGSSATAQQSGPNVRAMLFPPSKDDTLRLRVQATIYEVQFGPREALDLNADNLSTVSSAAALYDTLGKLGQTQVLFKVDQNVAVAQRARLSASTERPIPIAGSDGEGPKYTRAVDSVEFDLEISPRQEPETAELAIQIGRIVRTGEAPPPGGAVESRKVQQRHAVSVRFGHPNILITIVDDPPVDGVPRLTAYVTRLVLSPPSEAPADTDANPGATRPPTPGR